jgi:polysaccharide chain length determinant protein (PEP-CTERM system associated)
MHELIDQVLREVRGAWRFRWPVFALSCVVAIAGWAFVLMIPPTYETKARVFIDTETVLKPLLSGLAVGTDVNNHVNMVSAVLMSRPNLEKVARDTDLYLRVGTPEDLDSLLTGLSKKIFLAGERDGTYSIAYRDSDPQMAHRVVRRLLDTFVEGNLDVKRADSASAQRFLETQIKEYEGKLRQAEDRLAEFKRRNVGLMPEEGSDYYGRLQTAMKVLEDLQARYRVLQDKRTELQHQIDGEEPTFGLAPTTTQAAGPHDAQIAQYRAQIDALLVTYTEKHPQVIALRESIAKLEEDNKQALATGKASIPVAAATIDPSTAALRRLDVNPVYQNMKMALSSTELEFVELRHKLSDQQSLVNDLRSKVNTVPEVEAQLVRLNRDYEVNHAQYQALVQRLESARLSDSADQNTEQVKFRIIEPPLVPVHPVAPNRPLMLTAVLLIALGAAGLLAVVLSRLKPVFSSRVTLSQATGLPVLGTLSVVLSDAAQRALKRQPLYYAAGIGGLVVAYLVVLAFSSVVTTSSALFG